MDLYSSSYEGSILFTYQPLGNKRHCGDKIPGPHKGIGETVVSSFWFWPMRNHSMCVWMMPVQEFKFSSEYTKMRYGNLHLHALTQHLTSKSEDFTSQFARSPHKHSNTEIGARNRSWYELRTLQHSFLILYI